MQPTLSKNGWFNISLVSPQILISSYYDFYQSSNKLSHQKLSSILLLLSLLFLTYKNRFILNATLFLYTLRLLQPCLHSFIDLEKASCLLFATRCRVEEENKAKTVLLNNSSKVDTNETNLYFCSEDLDLDRDSLSSKGNNDDYDYWEDLVLDSKKDSIFMDWYR